ncbi:MULTISPECIES: HMA2 domain-containing protein [unclassified Fusobacterium]|uniref:HMA2 domain-containing protein n=1 Tax=unclassified Fusobacterium TaxID=2648384 RepID=UPI0025B943C6|nr:cation transporter [Fusobacterium sp.]
MVNGLLKTAFLYFNKIKVVHSIPGRLRLQIPGLDKVPEDMKKYEHYTTSIIKLENGIEEITYSYVTSKILVKYNPQLTNEKKIVEWLNFVWKKIVDNEDVYKNMSVKEIEENLDKFYEILYKELKKGR